MSNRKHSGLSQNASAADGLSARESQPESLADIRDEISALDNDLLALLSRRRALSLAVAINKEGQEKPVRDQSREKELLEKLVQLGSKQQLDAHYVTTIFHAIIEDSVNIQRKYLQSKTNPDLQPQPLKRVAVLGGKGSYSYLAANKYFRDNSNSYLGCEEFSGVINSVEQSQVDFGVLPIENTTNGGITEVYDLLLDSRLSIVGEEKYPIEHCLVAARGSDIDSVSVILSHPEAARQCSHHLKQLPDAELKLVSSTSEALAMAASGNQTQVAAIASEKSATEFGLEILQADFADLDNNTTRFLVLAREPVAVSKQITSKTSLAISTGQQPGSLAEVLQVFKQTGLLLTRLESRPIAGRPWEQMFYIDFEGNIADPNVSSALAEAGKICSFIKVLGCYPAESIEATQVSPKALSKAKLAALAGQQQNAPKKTAAKDSAPISSRLFKTQDTLVQVRNCFIGGEDLVTIADLPADAPVDSLDLTIQQIKDTGAGIVRWHPGSAASLNQLPAVTEITNRLNLPLLIPVASASEIVSVQPHCDMLEVSGESMFNRNLLEAIGQQHMPVVLCRNPAASHEEWLAAADAILGRGNMQVVLCDGGTRGVEGAANPTLDISSLANIRNASHLPLLVAPSTANLDNQVFTRIARAVQAAGVQGIRIPVATSETATEKCDGDPMGYSIKAFAKLMFDMSQQTISKTK